jgi:hypothetical protein
VPYACARRRAAANSRSSASMEATLRMRQRLFGQRPTPERFRGERRPSQVRRATSCASWTRELTPSLL